MAEVHTVHSVIAQIEHLLRAKSGRLVLVSPYTRPSPNIRDRLAHAAKQRDTPIQLVVRANELKPEELEAIGTIPGVELRLVPKLHAKCYCSDEMVIITASYTHAACVCIVRDLQNTAIFVLMWTDHGTLSRIPHPYSICKS